VDIYPQDDTNQMVVNINSRTHQQPSLAIIFNQPVIRDDVIKAFRMFVSGDDGNYLAVDPLPWPRSKRERKATTSASVAATRKGDNKTQKEDDKVLESKDSKMEAGIEITRNEGKITKLTGESNFDTEFSDDDYNGDDDNYEDDSRRKIDDPYFGLPPYGNSRDPNTIICFRVRRALPPNSQILWQLRGVIRAMPSLITNTNSGGDGRPCGTLTTTYPTTNNFRIELEPKRRKENQNQKLPVDETLR
jgi:hypothetical protein